MPPIATPLELYKELPRTNCRDCGAPSCLAFAAAVLKDEIRLDGCPHLGRSVIARIRPNLSRQVNLESIREEQLAKLKKRIQATDIRSRASLLGARHGSGTIIVTCLGKDFEVDQAGNVLSQCHTHTWFSLPLLDYVLHSSGTEPSGRWVPFRELPSGSTWNLLFAHRCEEPLKRLADVHSELFADLARMFGGASSPVAFGSDISAMFRPFPKVPILICYWRPEEDIESRIHLFFDDTAEKNLSIESIFTLGTGLVLMFEKIMHRHSDGRSELS